MNYANVLIVGDSQAEATGLALQKRLLAEGVERIERHAKHGADSHDVLELAQNAQRDDYDLVVVFSHDQSGGAPATHIPDIFPRAKVIWYGTPPATAIGDVAYARQVFGDKVTGSNYWFDSGYAAQREAENKKWPSLLPKGVTYVDWRTLDLPSPVTQQNGVKFPVLKDGIHILGGQADAAVGPLNWPPMSRPNWPLLGAAALGAFALGKWLLS